MIRNNQGFTLFNLILVVVAIALMGTVAVELLTVPLQEQRLQKTIQKVQQLQNAIYGNPELYATGQRSFVTDMGRLPLTLDELTTNTQNDSNWHGPYYESGFFASTNVSTDGMGNALQYNPQSGVISVDSASFAGKVGSPVLTDSVRPQFGDIEGLLIDLTGETYRRSANRYLMVIYLEFLGSNLSPIVQDIDKDTEVFRAFWFTEWYRRVYGDDPADNNFNPARHKWYWGWYWWKNFGRSHSWPYDQWDCSRWQFKDMYGHLNFGFQAYWDWVRQRALQIMSTVIAVRPDSTGMYNFSHLPVGNYIITAYDYKLLIQANSFCTDWVDNGQTDDDDSDFEDAGNQGNNDQGYGGGHNWWKKNKHSWQWGWYFKPGQGWKWGWNKPGQGWIDRKLYRYTVDRAALKRYVKVRENQTAKANFAFNGYFVGNQPWFWVDSSGAGGGGGGGTQQDKDRLRVNIQNLKISGKNYNNLTFENNANSAIIIDKLRVSWSGGGTSRLDGISIGGTSCWPGGSNKQSGELVDIQNKQLNANSSNVGFALHWTNSGVSGGNVRLVFTMGDGSERVINSAGDGN